MKCFRVAFAIFFLVGFAGAASAQDDASSDSLKISRLVICTDIVEREPSGEGTSFPNTTTKLYAFTHVEGAADETEITHRWSHNGVVRAEVKLPVKSSSWRTKSSKNIWHAWTGEWKVEVLDAEGEVLSETTFTIEEPEE